MTGLCALPLAPPQVGWLSARAAGLSTRRVSGAAQFVFDKKTPSCGLSASSAEGTKPFVCSGEKMPVLSGHRVSVSRTIGVGLPRPFQFKTVVVFGCRAGRRRIWDFIGYVPVL